jgi:hypothetical protein
MRKVLVVWTLLMVLGVSGNALADIDNPNIASLDAETFVVVSGTSVYLMKLDGTKMVLKDCVSLYTTQQGNRIPNKESVATMRRQEVQIQ